MEGRRLQPGPCVGGFVLLIIFLLMLYKSNSLTSGCISPESPVGEKASGCVTSALNRLKDVGLHHETKQQVNK